MNIFSISSSTGIFPDKLKVVKISPIFKNGEKDLLTINQYQFFHVSQKY